MGASLVNLEEGSVGQPGVGSSTGEFERWLNRVLDVGHFYRSSVKGTWREDSLPGDREAYVEKALELGVSLHRGPDGLPGRGLIY